MPGQKLYAGNGNPRTNSPRNDLAGFQTVATTTNTRGRREWVGASWEMQGMGRRRARGDG